MTTTPIRLTQTVKKGGCAAKIGAGALRDLLRSLPVAHHRDLLVGNDTFDDAAVWRVSDDVAMIHTLDFFTPILDDPFDFGAVAAANALSDVFAMGGTPVTALTILAYPLGVLPDDVLGALMQGAIQTITAAGAHLVGGHSIEDDTLKFGFSVSGLVRPDALWTNQGARVGDALVLTKALGTGTLSAALKNDEISAEQMAPAIASMKQLNRLDLTSPLHAAIHAATDVTGFGLLGHALHIAQGSSVTLQLEAEAVPLLDGARESLSRGILTKAHGTNSLYVQAEVGGREDIDDLLWLGLVDPQTSGGLLLSVAPEDAEALVKHVRPSFPMTSVIGTVMARGSTAIRVR